jgi:hypothetical protein
MINAHAEDSRSIDLKVPPEKDEPKRDPRGVNVCPSCGEQFECQLEGVFKCSTCGCTPFGEKGMTDVCSGCGLVFCRECRESCEEE